MTKANLPLLCLLCGACAPEFVDHTWLVEEPRALAVRAEPAEAKPGADIKLEALIAVPRGSAAPELSWNYCATPKPLTQNNSVSSACLDPTFQKPIGVGASLRTKLPLDACRTFGPEAPPGEARARDPDVTGGYFQPLVMNVEEHVALHLQRLQCALANAPADVASDFAAQYQANANPRISGVRAMSSRKSIALEQIPAGAEVTLSVTWEQGARENYRHFDLQGQGLADRQETLRLSWHTDGGTLMQPFTQPVDDHESESQNTWLAPDGPGEFQIWVVLRDSRGGVDFTTLRATVAD